ncbi:hypothetical protein BKA82DRAFT_4097016 [Pisolithus tinctorius]|nr:hypothetical protein BKA82DRAFT_4097016 [Pisolithus tinctorius]
MDNHDTNKTSHRSTPLPPSSNVTASSGANVLGTVAPGHFYGQKNPPPPLPSRPKNLGSSHTKVIRPSTPPPDYSAPGNSPFREPQLVEEAPIIEDPVPALLPAAETTFNSWTNGTSSDWSTGKAWEDDAWNAQSTSWDSGATWAQHYDPGGYTVSASKLVDIDGRDPQEEENWWDASVRERCKRPGPGVLPPYLAEMLHNPEHSLYSVSVITPDIRPDVSTSRDGGDTGFNLEPPSKDDLIHAVPHPNVYYCRKHYGWVLLQWKSSTILPPLAKSFAPDPLAPLPDLAHRRRTVSCVGDAEQPFGPSNKTHHFHYYEKAVDAHKLDPAFRRAGWEQADLKKERRRKITSLNLAEFSVDKMREDAVVEDEEEEEGDLLDLYVCCQCSVYCVVSDVIPGVIPMKFLEECTRDRWDNPPPNKNREESVVSALETFLLIVENKLWKGENRSLPVHRRVFQQKIGWTSTVRHIFERLGFVLTENENTQTGAKDETMMPPNTDPTTLQGKDSRRKLLRFWVETSAWLLEYRNRHANMLKNYTFQRLWVKMDPAREMYQMGIGAHPNQIPRLSSLSTMLEFEPVQRALRGLGMTPTTYTPELLMFAYMAQCRCDPAQTPLYFSQFFTVVQAMQEFGEIPPQDVQNLVFEERSRNRFTEDDLRNAVGVLGFGKDGPLRVELDADVDDDFIAEAWKDCVRRAWRDAKNGIQRQRDANEAFRIVAESRGSTKLRKMWEDSSKNAMDPNRAYTILEVPPETDESMLMTVYMMRVEEQPHQSDRMRDALATIAEARDSYRIRKFLETGQDPGDMLPPTRADLPRGLNQLGNTCYLNSLLQYFYTIKDLRDAITPLATTSVKSVEDEKYSDDDLKKHRVGGRLITRREILRSRKFVGQLADLFWQLEYCESAAVTPTMDLAKLALVTPRDEEDDEVDKGGTDSSNDTDATLVEDPPSRLVKSDSPNSVLGKRPREDRGVPMEIDEDVPGTLALDAENNGYVMVSHPPSPRRSKSPRIASASSSSSQDVTVSLADRTEAVQASEDTSKKPPLPARKPAANSESVMLFGKQHDVAECMDNCMFQIEIALLKFDDMSDAHDKGSIVKRLFYGKLRQRISVLPDQRRSRLSVHEKQDLFSHLPVNVIDSGIDIYDGLSSYFDDTVEFEGSKARMEVSLVELPPLLQIQLQRVQFNRETLQPYKSQVYVRFGETIYMDRFLDTADPLKKAKSKSIQAALNSYRERLRLLTEDKHAPFGPPLENTLNFLSKQQSIELSQVNGTLVAQLNDEQTTLSSEVAEVKAEIAKLKEELEGVWKDDRAFPYELTSVFIHRGSSPSFGHYFFYSRHLPEKPDNWFKYNDSVVTEVSKNVVLADTTGSTENPYLLVFARKGSDVVQTVKRFDNMSFEDTPVNSL